MQVAEDGEYRIKTRGKGRGKREKGSEESSNSSRHIQSSNMTINVHPFNILITLYQFLSIPCLLQCLWMLYIGWRVRSFCYCSLLLFAVCLLLSENGMKQCSNLT